MLLAGVGDRGLWTKKQSPRCSGSRSRGLAVPAAITAVQPEGCATIQATPPRGSPSSMPSLVRNVKRDLDAALERDPAARSAIEVLLAYPGFHARQLHRLAHLLHRRGV